MEILRGGCRPGALTRRFASVFKQALSCLLLLTLVATVPVLAQPTPTATLPATNAPAADRARPKPLAQAALDQPPIAGSLPPALVQGLLEEEANLDLPAAIKAYQSVISQVDEQRRHAANALFRLGECYRKLGQTNEAQAQYLRLQRDYSDQTEFVRLSQRFTGGEPAVAAATVTDEETKEVQRIRALIQNSPDLINANQGAGLTLLHQAAQSGQVLVARFLLANQAAVNAHDGDRKTPLMLAAQAGHKAMVELVLNHGAAVNLGDQYGSTALSLAAANGFRNVVEVLLANHAEVNTKGSNGATALEWAARNGHTAVVEFLLANGADVNTSTIDGLSPLISATRKGHQAIVELLLGKGAEVNPKNQGALSPLRWAVDAKQVGIATVLVQHKAEVNVTDKDGNTPLTKAVENGQPEMVELLLKHGANPNVRRTLSAQFAQNRGPRTVTPLHLAVERKNRDMVALLLAHGADVNAKDQSGVPPLHYAVGGGQLAIAELLLARQPELELVANWTTSEPPLMSTDSLTALELAVSMNNLEMVELLLSKGANVDTQDLAGRSSLHWATGRNRPEIMRALLAKKPNLEARSGPNATGDTPLQNVVRQPRTAEQASNVELARLLLEAGANVNVVSEADGKTPLFWAVEFRNPGLVETLLAHKAEVNLLDRNGRSPLSYLNPSGNRAGPQAGGLPGGIQAIPLGSLGVGSTTGSAYFEAIPQAPGMLPPPAGVGGRAPAPSKEEEGVARIRAMLLKAGANENFERLSFISTSRPAANSYETVFKRGTNLVNRFSLFELIAHRYSMGDAPAFPDFHRVKIDRLVTNSLERREQAVDVEAMLNPGDCSKDQWLEWGDVVVIPEADHKLNERWQGNSPEFKAAMRKCLQRKVQIRVKDQLTPVSLVPFPAPPASFLAPPAQQDAKTATEPVIANFWLHDVVRGCGLLRTSSDTSRVKVKRMDPETKQPIAFVFDLEKTDPHTLWLRDGDLIEIPENQ